MRSSVAFVAVFALAFAVACASASSLYGAGSDVVELTASNFQSKVIDSDTVWLVEFYAPWCGHCKSLAPEWSKAASALKGIVRVGAVNMDEHQSVGSPYGITGFPTIKLFGADKASPVDYKNARTASAITDFALQQAKATVTARLGGKSSSSSSSSSSGSGSAGGKQAVVELTDANFAELVLNSQDVWLVEFFAPWCGHCKNLAPIWEAAAKKLDGKVKVGALDATVHSSTAGRYNIKGYPTIKVFGADKANPSDYQGGRSENDIVQAALERLEEMAPPPEVHQLVSQAVWDKECASKQLCVVAFLPDILDSGATGRNNYIATIQASADKHKSRSWGYVWAESNAQSALEQAVNVGGSGYPALVAISPKKNRYAQLIGALNEKNLSSFLTRLQNSKESTAALTLPAIATGARWDGKDGVPPSEEL